AYLDSHADEMAEAPLPGPLAGGAYQDWSQPKWVELKADHMATADFPESGPLGLQLGLQVLRHGACPGAACRLEALIHTDGPILSRDHKQIDQGMIAQWLMAAQGHGAVVWERSPDVLAGASLRHPNPLPGATQAWQAGVVAVSVVQSAGSGGGSNQGDTEDFLRVGDTRNPDFQGSATVKGDIGTQSSLTAARYLVLAERNSEYHVCGVEGALSVERGFQGLLLCSSGLWRSAGRAAGGGFSHHSVRGCVNSLGQSTRNPVTRGCFCPDGYVPVQISDSGSDPVQGRTQGYICVVNRSGPGA
ncbi:MAG: hypothetical protein L0H54_13830, partial [Alcaligenaceae bacterium]|nr:hypothetical protein [Alcaligenaceae bacterium]